MSSEQTTSGGVVVSSNPESGALSVSGTGGTFHLLSGTTSRGWFGANPFIREGDEVTITLPNGSTMTGTVSVSKDKPKAKEDRVLVQARLDRETYVYFCAEKARHDKDNAELIADLLCKRHWADKSTNYLLGLASGVGTGLDCSKDKAVLIALHALLGLLRWAEEIGGMERDASPELQLFALGEILGFALPLPGDGGYWVETFRNALVRGAEAENTPSAG